MSPKGACPPPLQPWRHWSELEQELFEGTSPEQAPWIKQPAGIQDPWVLARFNLLLFLSLGDLW